MSGNLSKSATVKGHFERKFQTEGASPTNHLLVSEYSSNCALSCGIKISAVDCLVLSQSTRVTDRQNYDR